MAYQLPLSITLRDDASFDNFYPAGNEALLQHLHRVLAGKTNEGSILVWGGKGVGKTHLLQASCLYASQHNLNAVYLPMTELKELSTELLDGLETCSLICVDDLDIIASHVEWEQAFFHLYNRVLEQKVQIIFSMSASITELAWALADLKSRLSWGLVFHLKELAETDKAKALQKRAQLRGFEIPDAVMQYLMRRYPRDMNALFDLLNKLDKASLSAQRKITVPFIKEWIESQ